MIDNKTDQQWKHELGDERYAVLRQKATEAPFSGKYNEAFENGMYHCAGCGADIFASDTKFASSCGWPSFYDAIEGGVKFIEDTSHGMYRTEVVCSNCGGHLGHVFMGEGLDNPIDQRFCINSLSLSFTPDK